MKLRTLLTLGTLLLSLSGVIALAACSGNRQQDAKTAKDIVHLADDTCVVIRDFARDGGPANDVCAKEEEIAPFINMILGSRRAAAARLDGGSPTIPDASK
jgi:hypothetical protein